jgi:uncharacterized coiled-coil DUF342 family protein
MSETKPNLPPETQQQRWMKYGANVALSIVVGIALVILFTFLAQAKDHRFDTTQEGVYSLKPQTLSIIGSLKSPIKIVSLYSKESNREDIDTYSQTVQDLLDEYRASGKEIEVDFIDPLNQPAKADALINEVTTKYGGEVKAYNEFLDEYKKQYDVLKKKIDDEDKMIHAVSFDDVKAPDLGRSLMGLIDTVDQLPDLMEQTKDNVDRKLKQKPPDYKGAVDSAQQNMDDVSQEIVALEQEIAKDKDNAGTPPPVKSYLTDSVPRYDEIKKLADTLEDKAKKLGDLKLDTLRQSLKERDSILVMGENDMRVLPFDQVWKNEDTLRQYARDGKIKPVFAGEQLITTAIYGLTQNKKIKIAFVRPGGPPLTDPGMPPFQAGGPLSQAADRLRQYNFDVVEKDLSGQYALQAEEQGQPAPPEPSDAELQDAIWVVIAAPSQQNNGPMGPIPSATGPKLLEHLDGGGSAFILPFPQEDSPINPLKSWGIDLRTDAVAVHDTPPPQAGASDDPADEMMRRPYVFNIRDYGDSPITKPLRSLDSELVPLFPVKTHEEKGVTVTPLIPVPGAPGAPACWGETDLDSLEKGDTPTFDPKVDIAPPLFAGAAAEKQGGGRVVVIASSIFIFNQTLSQVDPDLARKRIFVPAFPGNIELFTNSIFWLAHQDSMISISPAAMQVQRIADMSDATLNAWRVGLLLVGLPGAVIIAGFMMYFARRD